MRKSALVWSGLVALLVGGLIAATVTLAVTMHDDGGRSATYVASTGMMGSGGTFGGIMGGTGLEGRADVEPVGSMQEVADRVDGWLADAGFDSFRPAEVMAFSNGYYVAVHDPDGQGAFELLVDPATGWISPEPGPNMMWNIEYGVMAGRLASGMMGGAMMGEGMMGGGAGPATGEELTPAEAQAVAEDWLELVVPGEETEAPRAFPGYYTLDTERDGEVDGMLSVNARTGAVWYHVWHGSFLDELEL